MKTLLIVLALIGLLLAAAVVVWVYVIQNVETPDYGLIEQDGSFEIRDYPALTVAEVHPQGPRREALGRGFRPLASYIFAKERDGEKIAMTAPVIQSPDDGGWTVQFVMPSGRSVEDLPAPASDVSLTTVPARRMAAVRFSGRATDEDFREQEQALRDWLAARGIETRGPAIHAHYNDPFTPGFLRRTEVLLEIADTP